MIRRCILAFSELLAFNFKNEGDRDRYLYPQRYDYSGYKVLEIYPKSTYHLRIIQDLQFVLGLDIWSTINKTEMPTTIMVSPDRYIEFIKFLDENSIPYVSLIQDVQKTIDRERYVQLSNPNTIPITTPTGGQASVLSFYKYHRPHVIEQYLKYIEYKYPNRMKLIRIGKSYEGRPLYMVKISTSNRGLNRPAILIDGGAHAREWISVATVLYLIYSMVENYEENMDLVDGIDWYLMPCLNPDGYEYSHTDIRLWRKTRSRTRKPYCRGADLNRNFSFHWLEQDVEEAKDPCSPTYAGSASFSEPESKAYSDFAMTIRSKLKLYVSLHSFGTFVLYPWGFTRDLPDNRDELHELGEKFNENSDYTYIVGNSTRLLYPASGTSDDWFKGALGVRLSYTIELPGGGSEGFDLPQNKIIDVGEDMLNGVRVFAEHIRKKYK